MSVQPPGVSGSGESRAPVAPVAAALGELVSGDLVAAGIVRDGRIEFANEGFASLFGYRVAELTGRVALVDLAIDADKAGVSESLRRSLAAAGRIAHLEFTGLRQDGGVVVVDMRARGIELGGEPAALLAMLDVTERTHAVNRLRDLAFHDSLTDLPNRALFFDRLRHCVAAARRSGERAAVMVADLDGFKAVNDVYGHDSGDVLLQAVAQRLARSSREADTVARIGGDEFAAILPRIGGRELAAGVAERMIKALQQPFRIGPRECTVSVSIGIALCPDNGADVSGLMAAADAAMYESKASGKNTLTFASGQPVPLARLLIDWSDTLLVGIEIIDGQHRRLIDLANALAEGLQEGHDTAAVKRLLANLFEHVVLHFRTEEGLMEAYQVDDVDRHRQEHRLLLSDLHSLGTNLQGTSVMLALQHLRSWLVRHVESLDRELADKLRARGCS